MADFSLTASDHALVIAAHDVLSRHYKLFWHTVAAALAVGSAGYLARVEAAAVRAGVRARLHLKADTGLSRGGATPADYWQRLNGAPSTGGPPAATHVVPSGHTPS